MAKQKLTPKQKLFVKEYLIDFNATRAAKAAGYSKKTARQIGTDNLSKVAIRTLIDQKIEKRSEKIEITADKVLKDIEEVRLMCMEKMPVLDRDGEETGEFKFHPQAALKASELQGKHIAMFKDRLEHSGPNGQPIKLETEFTVNFIKNPKKE